MSEGEHEDQYTEDEEEGERRFRRSRRKSTSPAPRPTVFENIVQDITVDGQVVEMSLWDTAGASTVPLRHFPVHRPL